MLFSEEKSTVTEKLRQRIGVLLALLMLALPIAAQDAPPPAEIQNDEGGPVIVEGQMNYTNLFFTSGVAQPIVLLEDQAGFVSRDNNFIFPKESQVLGNFTTDYYTPPVSYNINLPIEPRGTLVDVDNDTNADVGVMVYTPAYWTNTFGDPFLEKREAAGAGWSTAYAGTLINDERELIGGAYVIYAPEAGQGFPSGFGDDGLLFTEDDPIVTVPQGWTTVYINDGSSFTFDRARTAVIDLLEPESAALVDFSADSYTVAFDGMIELMRERYSFTEYKSVDWDAIAAEFRPRVEEAERNNDALAFKLAIRDLSWSIPDGHVAVFGDGAAELTPFFVEATSGGLGLNLAELDDGRVIVSFVLEDSPASNARIQPGDEVVALNGKPIQVALEETVVYAAPFSTPHNLRIQQLRYAVRYPIGTEVALSFINSGTGELNTVTLVANSERTTWSRTSILNGAPSTFNGPVQYRLLESGYAYVTITDFLSNEVLTIQSWENFLTEAKNNQVAGIIVDMRYNSGGSPLLANQMAGYFYDEETVIGYRGEFNRERGEFFVEEDAPTIVYPAPETFRYAGPVAVMVGPACASACETFSYAMSQLGEERVLIVGQYPSAGLGGGVNDFLLPAGLRFRFTVNRGLDANQEIHIEGIGVVPNVRVPITEETVFATNDIVLDAAVNALNELTSAPFEQGQDLTPNDSASGSLVDGVRIRHNIVGPAAAVNITVTLDNPAAAPRLTVYATDGTLLGTVDQDRLEGLPLLAAAAGETLVLEIATVDDVNSGYTVTTATP